MIMRMRVYRELCLLKNPIKLLFNNILDIISDFTVRVVNAHAHE